MIPLVQGGDNTADEDIVSAVTDPKDNGDEAEADSNKKSAANKRRGLCGGRRISGKG